QTQGTGSSIEKNADLNFWTCERKAKIGEAFAIQARTRRSGIKLFSSFRLDSSQAIQPETVEREKFIGAEFSLKLTQNQATSFDKIAVNYWEQTGDTEQEQAWADGLNMARKYSRATYEQELEEHNNCWADFWRRMDIEIGGDPELQQGVRYSLYAMFINYHGESDRRNVLCKLGGEVYNGVNFWDTEIYCLRMYMFLNPEIARKLLMYRYHYLPKALENAKRVDLEGARYPFAT
ncbi:MAG TPA: family 65 glycosyl hydrolase, partial [Firmicutes bacterium]|nr:family 65 glycosyl hydrolase [Bacillota bacterium]